MGKKEIYYFYPYLKDDSGFLQQVSSHVGSYNLISLIKTDFCVFPKPTTVVIAGGLGISDSLQNTGLLITLKRSLHPYYWSSSNRIPSCMLGKGLTRRGRLGGEESSPKLAQSVTHHQPAVQSSPPSCWETLGRIRKGTGSDVSWPQVSFLLSV